MEMSYKNIVKQLDSLKGHCDSMAENNRLGTENVWEDDSDALSHAINIIKRLDYMINFEEHAEVPEKMDVKDNKAALNIIAKRLEGLREHCMEFADPLNPESDFNMDVWALGRTLSIINELEQMTGAQKEQVSNQVLARRYLELFAKGNNIQNYDIVEDSYQFKNGLMLLSYDKCAAEWKAGKDVDSELITCIDVDYIDEEINEMLRWYEERHTLEPYKRPQWLKEINIYEYLGREKPVGEYQYKKTFAYKDEAVNFLNHIAAKAEFFVFDFETTGLNPADADILQLSAIKVAKDSLGSWAIVDSIDKYVNPGYPIPEKITELTGIDDEMVTNAPDLVTVAEEIKQFLGDNPIMTGYNSMSFDMKFMNKLYEAIGEKLSPDYEFDVLLMARDTTPGSHKLSEIAKSCGVADDIKFHSASEDVLATYRVMNKLLPKYGLKELSEGDKNLDYSRGQAHKALGVDL